MLRVSALVTCLSMSVALLWWGGCNKPVPELELYQPPPEKDYGRPLPPGALALRKIPPEMYPDFRAGLVDRAGLEAAILNSLNYLGKKSSQRYFPYGDISHDRAVRSLRRFLELVQGGGSANAIDAAIRQEFDVYQSVGCDDRGTVFFTGYYTPIFDGRLRRDERFRYPLYKFPPNLVKGDEGQILGWKRPDGSVDPVCPTRKQIEQGRMLDGLEVAWLSDPFEAYIVTVQGSAKLRLADGTVYELGYSGNNGHTYTPIRDAMVKDGVIGRNEVSLKTLRAYFAQHPDKVYHYCWTNDRYVFFKQTDGGPFGSLGEPVIPYRSIATDKEVFPRACLSFIVTDLPKAYDDSVRSEPYAGFTLDQDTGGAIRAAGRCDVYMGVGPRAEALAGRTSAEGKLYYIFLKQ